jgi:hypothetical protein
MVAIPAKALQRAAEELSAGSLKTHLKKSDNGQGKVAPVAHLLAKDKRALLKESGVAAVLDKGLVKLQASAFCSS